MSADTVLVLPLAPNPRPREAAAGAARAHVLSKRAFVVGNDD